MLAAEAIRLTEETAKELRARGQDDHATALERVLSVAAAALGGPRATPPAYLTLAQVARMLGGGAELVKDLVARGDLQAERFGRRLLISRAAILAYFERAKSQPLPRSTQGPEQRAAHTRLHQVVMKGLPADDVARQAALLDKIEAGERLTRAERAELADLVQSLADASAKRLELWIDQSGSNKP